jgi:hypothetical protein
MPLASPLASLRPDVSPLPSSGSRQNTSTACGKGTRRVQLVRRDGRDVSTLYGREGGGGGCGGGWGGGGGGAGGHRAAQPARARRPRGGREERRAVDDAPPAPRAVSAGETEGGLSCIDTCKIETAYVVAVRVLLSGLDVVLLSGLDAVRKIGNGMTAGGAEGRLTARR